MIEFLNNSNKEKKGKPTVVYLHVEKETIMVEQVFNMLFEMLDNNDNPSE